MDVRTFVVAMVERLTNLLDLIEDKKKACPISRENNDLDLARLEFAAMNYLTTLLTTCSKDKVKE